MFKDSADKITQILVESNIIKSDERELYSYGFNQGLTILLNLLTALVIGLFFNCVLEIIFFLTAYIPLRSYAGGYHAKTPMICYYLSIFLLVIVESAVKYLDLNFFEFLVVYFITSAVILNLSPIEDLNKPLDGIECKTYKRKVINIWITESIILWVLFTLDFKIYAFCILIVYFVLTIMLVLGLLKNCLIAYRK